MTKGPTLQERVSGIFAGEPWTWPHPCLSNPTPETVSKEVIQSTEGETYRHRCLAAMLMVPKKKKKKSACPKCLIEGDCFLSKLVYIPMMEFSTLIF